MICKDIKTFSQNVHKNSLLINIILEVNSSFDIIFIQELFWSSICSILSSSNYEGDTLVGMVNYPNWLTFIRSNISESDYLRVIAYINIRLSSFCFSFWKDIIDHRDILLTSFFNNGELFWLMNIYLDASHSALKYLKDTEVNFCNLLIMTGDFNIRDSLWDSSFLHYSSISDDLIILADSFNLLLLVSTNQIPTRYTDNINDSNLTINLMFIQCESPTLNNHSISSEWCLSSDHTPLTVTIPISEEVINICKSTIKKDSNKEAQFIKDTISRTWTSWTSQIFICWKTFSTNLLIMWTRHRTEIQNSPILWGTPRVGGMITVAVSLRNIDCWRVLKTGNSSAKQ